MTDPIADFLTRIRNAVSVGHKVVEIPGSKIKLEMTKILKEKGYDFYIDSPTNQIFVEMEDEKLKELEKNVRVSFWEKTDEKHTVVRFATSWATDMEKVENLREYL